MTITTRKKKGASEVYLRQYSSEGFLSRISSRYPIPSLLDLPDLYEPVVTLCLHSQLDRPYSSSNIME
nr:hypothetical protein Q903MT_gene2026 [Picea sitchensis]